MGEDICQPVLTKLHLKHVQFVTGQECLTRAVPEVHANLDKMMSSNSENLSNIQ